MKIKIVKTRFEQFSNRYIPLIVVNGELEPSSTSYFMRRIQEGDAFNTIEVKAKAVKKLFEFCAETNIQLLHRISKCSPLKIGEIEALSSFYRINVKTGEPVAASTLKLRWITTQEFLNFLWEFYNGKVSRLEDKQLAKLNKEQMNASFNLMSRTPYKTNKSSKIGLPPELKAKFYEIINPLPENTLNVWNSEFVRWRNFCLIITMILGGNRKGESIGLRLNHFKISGSSRTRKYFEIRDERHEDYPHKIRPSVKTSDREVDLSSELVNIFQHYIISIRPSVKNHEKTSYMFLSKKSGKVIGLTTINDSFQELFKAYPEFKGKLSPHRLRNTFFDSLNDKINEAYREKGAYERDGKSARLMEYSGGWASGSHMPNHYAKGSIQREVASFTLGIQEKLVEKYS